MGAFLRDERGLTDGLEYLIGEKFLNFIIQANPLEEADFAREIRRVFTSEQMAQYFKTLLRTRQPRVLAQIHRARLMLLGK